jgi:6-phosphofructokinase 1
VEFVPEPCGSHTLHQPLNIGCVLSGGQASGGHNCICGLFDYVEQKAPGSKIFGFVGGPMGVMKNRYRVLDSEFVDIYRNTGGFDMLTSGRDKIEKPEEFEAARQTAIANDLDGLVVIGGDDSNTNAAVLGEHFRQYGLKCKVIGLPKTIDGDLKNEYVETSFGFDTAAKLFSECVGNIMTDCLSTEKYYHFVRLMGREASHLTLEAALQTRPNMTFIGEEVKAKELSLAHITNQICDMVVERSEKGLNHGVVMIPEGLIDFVPEVSKLIAEINEVLAKDGVQPGDVEGMLQENNKKIFNYLPQAIQEQLLLDRDPHGNVQVAKIESERLFSLLCEKELSVRRSAGTYKGKFSVQCHYFGYEGRCTPPTDFDCQYCYVLGLTAAALIGHGYTGMMATIRGLYKPVNEWMVKGMPLTHMMNMERRKGKDKPVIKKALVELEGAPFKAFAQLRASWASSDLYRNPGPIQYGTGTDAATYTLRCEQLGVDATLPAISGPSVVAEARRNAEPELPEVLENTNCNWFAEETPTFDPVIAAGLPSTSNRPLLELKTASGGTPIQKKTLKIGFCFSGRQTPGGHTAIAGIKKFLDLHGGAGSKLLGFIGGTKGLFAGKYKEVTGDVTAEFMNQGGFHMLGRTADVIRGQEHIEDVAQVCKSLALDGLCIFGGTISMCDAGLLAEDLLRLGVGTKVIGIPGTIDGDLKGAHCEASIGYDTACRVYSSLIGHLQTDAASAAKYYYFVRVMGREASQIVLECGMQTQPNCVLVGEEIEGSRKTLNDVVTDIADMVEDRFAAGKNFGVILIPEGLVTYIPEINSLLKEIAKAFASGTGPALSPTEVRGKLSTWATAMLNRMPEPIQAQMLLAPEASTGAAQLNQIETERLLSELVAHEMAKRKADSACNYAGNFSPVCFYLGYQARSSMPSNFDCTLAYSLGCAAGALIAADKITTGYMVTMSGLTQPSGVWRPGAVPIAALLSMGRRAGNPVAILPPAPVDLASASFNVFAELREKWRVEDCYRNPGPLQFEGLAADLLGQLLLADHAKAEEQRSQVQQLLEKLRERVLGRGVHPGVLETAVTGLRSLDSILTVVSRTEDLARNASSSRAKMAYSGTSSMRGAAALSSVQLSALPDN